ncbi:glycosyl transferase 4 family protein, partial [Acinetobacter baumannii 754286]
MLLWLFEQLAGYHSSFQVVRYLTLRSLLSVLTSLTIGLVLGPIMIRKLQALKYGQAVSSFAPENHAKKMGTPTMGGILILLSIGISTLLWADLSNPYVWIVLGVMVVFGAVGWADDWIKIRYKDNAGLPARKKFFWTSVASLGAGIALYLIATQQSNAEYTANMLDLLIPFFKNLSIPLSIVPLGLAFIVFTYLVINGASNAVNLTDGLDGLAIMPVVMVATGLGVFAYLSGDIR